MIVRTTKQIWKQHNQDMNDLQDNIPDDLPELEWVRAYEFSVNEVGKIEWVCLSDLKKENIEKFEAIRHNAVTLAKHSYENAYAYLLECVMSEILNPLCNSSEQNDTERTGEDSQPHTGEDKRPLSSPVQNPNEGYSDSFSRVKASGQESVKNSPANFQKKCTCPKDDIKLFQLKNKYSSCCRCGGAL